MLKRSTLCTKQPPVEASDYGLVCMCVHVFVCMCVFVCVVCAIEVNISIMTIANCMYSSSGNNTSAAIQEYTTLIGDICMGLYTCI